jgi:hypothetical protein
VAAYFNQYDEVVNPAGVTIDMTGATLTIPKAVTGVTGGTLTNEGTITGGGSIVNLSDSTFTNEAGGTVGAVGAGLTLVNGDEDNPGRMVLGGTVAADIENINGALEIAGDISGHLTVDGGSVSMSGGRIRGGGAATAVTVNAGVFEVNDGRVYGGASFAIVNNSGTVIYDGDGYGRIIADSDDPALIVQGEVKESADGPLITFYTIGIGEPIEDGAAFDGPEYTTSKGRIGFAGFAVTRHHDAIIAEAGPGSVFFLPDGFTLPNDIVVNEAEGDAKTNDIVLYFMEDGSGNPGTVNMNGHAIVVDRSGSKLTIAGKGIMTGMAYENIATDYGGELVIDAEICALDGECLVIEDGSCRVINESKVSTADNGREAIYHKSAGLLEIGDNAKVWVEGDNGVAVRVETADGSHVQIGGYAEIYATGIAAAAVALPSGTQNTTVDIGENAHIWTDGANSVTLDAEMRSSNETPRSSNTINISGNAKIEAYADYASSISASTQLNIFENAQITTYGDAATAIWISNGYAPVDTTLNANLSGGVVLVKGFSAAIRVTGRNKNELNQQYTGGMVNLTVDGATVSAGESGYMAIEIFGDGNLFMESGYISTMGGSAIRLSTQSGNFVMNGGSISANNAYAINTRKHGKEIIINGGRVSADGAGGCAISFEAIGEATLNKIIINGGLVTANGDGGVAIHSFAVDLISLYEYGLDCSLVIEAAEGTVFAERKVFAEIGTVIWTEYSPIVNTITPTSGSYNAPATLTLQGENLGGVSIAKLFHEDRFQIYETDISNTIAAKSDTSLTITIPALERIPRKAGLFLCDPERGSIQLDGFFTYEE